ncbi:MAG: pilus assembly protein [Cellvibrionales bacterium]|nr:pilus assembly protein [Cellvibrionales bacterium]
MEFSRQNGQALPELIITFPLIVIVIMGIIQLGLLYRGKAALNHATFVAARSGSLNHGFVQSMETAFLNKMVALGHINPRFKRSGTTEGLYNNPNRFNLAASQVAMRVSHFYKNIEVVWPTQAVFNRFAVRFQDLESCSGRRCPYYNVSSDNNIRGQNQLSSTRVYQIPFENQDMRSQRLLRIDGQYVDLQDANLLSIRSHYCYQLEVPVANLIIWQALRVFQAASKEWRNCQIVSATFGRDYYFIPLKGRSIVRMQSGFRCEGNLTRGRNCENFNY